MTYIKPLTDIAKAHYEWATTGSMGRIPLGFPFFDQATGGGVALGEVCMFLARSGVGKSWWACNVINNNPGVPTIFFSLEMQDRFMLQRLAAVHVGEPTQFMEAEIREKGSSASIERTIIDFPLLALVDTPEMSLKGMSQALKEYRESYLRVPELVVVDYMELVKAGLAMSALESIDNVSRQIKNWARTEDVALIVLHQTNMNVGARISERGNEVDNGHLPLTRQAARYGGDVAADYTIAMFKPSLDPRMSEQAREYRGKEVWMQLLKNRGGSKLYEGGVQHHVDVANWRITHH